MTSAAQVSAFCKDVAVNRRLWTIRVADKSYIKWQNPDGSEVFPVWSSQSRVERAIKLSGQFEGGEPKSFEFSEFVANWLPDFVKDKVGLGPNWAGKNLTGWTFKADELIRRVQKTPEFNHDGT